MRFKKAFFRGLIFPSALVFLTQARAEKIQLHKTSDEVRLAGKFELLEDSRRIFTADEILAGRAGKFAPASKEQSEIGFTRSAYWLRFQVANVDSVNSRWIFELWTVPTDRADLYVEENGEAVHVGVTGNQIASAPRKASYYPLELNLPHGASRTVLLRLESAQRMRAPINLWEPAALARRDDNKQAVMFLLFGIGFGLLVYNLFLFISLRERSYLYYVLYSCCAWILILGENGYVDHYLGGKLSWHWAYISPTMTLLTLSMMLVFGNTFLHLSEDVSQRWSKVVSGLVAFGLTLAASCLLPVGDSVYAARALALDLFVVVAVVSLVGSGIAATRMNKRQAPRYFLLAWSSFFAMILVWVAEANGLIPMNLFTRFGVETGLAAEGLLMSLALASRLHESRRRFENLLTTRNEKLEEAIQMRTLELRKALDSREDFISVASHELKTPLTALSLHLDIASKRAESDVKSSIQSARGQIGKINDLIDRLFDVTRIRSGALALDRRNCDLAKLVRDVADRLKVLADSSRVRLHVHLDHEVIFGFWDAARIEQVLTNLISNAFKYGGGRDVSIEVTHSPSEALVKIMDQGSGIPVEAHGRIFDRYHRDGDAETRAPGLGLGLYVSKKIAEVHGGDIEVENRAGGGSVFILRLPREGARLTVSLPGRGVKPEPEATITE